jgi:GAF domain-containing protein
VSDHSFLNTYHNASTPPPAEVPTDLASFMAAADEVLALAAELARVVTQAHQGAATQLIGDGWRYARKYFSLSEKYAAWAGYRQPAVGFGIHAYAHHIDQPLRLTDSELRAHPEWRNFGKEGDRHPPMRGWLVAPLIGSDRTNYGFIQASDKLSGDFTAQDEVNVVRMASLTATALDALAQVHLADYRAKIAGQRQT